MKNTEKMPRQSWVLSTAILGSIGLIVLSMFAPYLLTRPGPIDFSQTGQIGDTINGIAGPIIATLAALLTFAAFYVQYQANNSQRRQISHEAFENRFFRLIELHRKNVDGFEIETSKGVHITGEKVVVHICNLVNSIIEQVGIDPITNTPRDPRTVRTLAYLYVYHGKELLENHWFTENPKFSQIVERNIVTEIDRLIDSHQEPEYYVYSNGYINMLSRYFRQLIQIVKYVDEASEIDEKERYAYVRILRSNLGNREEEMLFNNALSPYGHGWVEGMYLTTYKLIKNVPIFYLSGYRPTSWLTDEFDIAPERYSEFFEHYEYS